MIMNKNGTNPGMNVEDYEEMAVQKSNVAKRVAAGAAIFVGGAAVAGGALAATQAGNDEANETLTTDDLVEGAEGTSEYQPQVEETHTVNERVIIQEPKPEPEPEPVEPEMTWDETTNVYVNGEKTMSVEEGTYQGHKFMLVDADGDNDADALAIDINSNGQFEENEVTILSDADNIYMGHETAHTTDQNYYYGEFEDSDSEQNELADNQHHEVIGNDEVIGRGDGSHYEEDIHNNFEDEKTGESYEGDYAENNPDYNPHGSTDDYAHANVYLADNNSYDEIDEADVEDNVYDTDNDLADADEESDSYDDMTAGEEFIG